MILEVQMFPIICTIIIFLNKINIMSSANKQHARPTTASYNAFPEKRKTIDMSNKSFFTNIKAELNSIRTDVNKLSSKETPSKWTGLGKSITLNQSARDPIRLQKKNSQTSPSNQADQEMVRKLSSQINDLTNKFQQQNKINAQLQEDMNSKCQENQWLKKKLEEMKNDCQEKSQTIIKLQRQCERNVQSFGSQNVNKLQHRIQQQQNEIQTKKCQLRALNQLNSKLQRKNQQSNKKFMEELVQMQRSYDDKMNQIQTQSYKQLGNDFEKKINDLIDENYALKNKITSLEGQIENANYKTKILQETIQTYEKRDEEMGKGANQIQLERLRNEIMKLQEENDRMQSDHEYEIMKLENQIDELRANPDKKGRENQSVNQILKDQITEIENLREKLREKNEMLAKLKK